MTFLCPFPNCGRCYQSRNALERHVLSMQYAVQDESHPRDDPRFATFQRPIHTRPGNLTTTQKCQRTREKHKRYDATRPSRHRSARTTIAPTMENPFLEEIKEFKRGWLNEAGKLKTPHWNVGLKLLNHLLDPAVKWTAVQPYTDMAALFDNPPLVDHLITDLQQAEKDQKLKLIDSRSFKPDGISQHSAENLVKCIESIEKRTFNTGSVHYSMRDMAASSAGLGECGPKSIPQSRLTSFEIMPKVPMSKSNPMAPAYTSIVTAGGTYAAIHYDFSLLAQFTGIVGRDTAKKLFFMWPGNKNNLKFMHRRARGETPLGWEDYFLDLTGLQVSILRHGQYMIMPEHTLRCVLTVGTAGVTGFGFARGECLANPELGVWDVERIEYLVDDGLSAIGRQALMIDVRNLLDELALVRQLESSSPVERFDVLEKRLRELEWRLVSEMGVARLRAAGLEDWN